MHLVMRSVTWLFIISFCAAALLVVMPLPEIMATFRPLWVSMVLVYWCLIMPERCSIGTGFMLGLLMDVYQGSVLGQHALSLSLLACMVTTLCYRIRARLPFQQAPYVGLMLLCCMGVDFLVQYIFNVPLHWPRLWAAPLASLLLWPWLYLLMQNLRQRYS